MTLTNEDLNAIGHLLDVKLDEKLDEKLNKKLDEKLQPINNRLDIIEYKQNRTEKKLDNLRLDIAVSEREIRRDISELKDTVETVVEVLKQNELLPS